MKQSLSVSVCNAFFGLYVSFKMLINALYCLYCMHVLLENVLQLFSVLIKFLFAQTVAGNERTRKGLFSDHHVAK